MSKIYNKLRDGFFFEWSLIIVAFCFPLYPTILNYAIGSAVFFFFFKKDILSRVITAFKSKIFILVLVFYLLHVLSLFLGNDKGYVVRDLQTKLSLIIFPLLFIGSGGFSYTKSEWFEKSFLFGLFVSIALCVYYAIVQSFNNPYSGGSFNVSIWADMLDREWWWLILSGNSYFNYSLFSHFIHPSYYALYLTLAAFLIVHKDQQNGYSIPNKIARNILISILLFVVFLLQSRAGLLGLLIFAVWSLIIGSRRTKITIMYVVLIFAVGSVILLTGRFERVTTSFSNLSWNNLKKTEIRFAIWEETLHLVHSKPIFGYGLSDAKPELVKQYNRDNISIAKDNEYNTHNEFLEILLQFGLVGLAILLSILFYPIFESKVDMQLYLFFITLVSLHFIFESMFERIAGVSFIMYFYSYINTLKLKYDTIFTAKN